MTGEYEKTLRSIMKLIVAQFGSKCEVVLHDWSREYDNTIIAIENGAVSGRKVGDGGSNLGLEVLRGSSDGSNHLNYLTRLPNGHVLKSSSLYLEDENGKKIGALCINQDVTDFISMQQSLSEITLYPSVAPGEQENSMEFITTDVNELLEYLIDQSTQIIGKDPADMTKDEKKASAVPAG